MSATAEDGMAQMSAKFKEMDTPYRRENHEAAFFLRDASLSAMLLRMRRSNVMPGRLSST